MTPGSEWQLPAVAAPSPAEQYVAAIQESANAGVFVCTRGDMAVWVNGEDHLRIVVANRGGTTVEAHERHGVYGLMAFDAAYNMLALLEKALLDAGKGLAAHRRLGHVCGRRLPTSALSPGVWLRRRSRSSPRSLDSALVHVCQDHQGLDAVPAPCYQDLTTASEGWWDICNHACIGRTEVQLAQAVLDAAASLQWIERRLAAGESLAEAMTPPPPPEAAPIQLGRAVRARGLRSLTLSAAELHVADWAARRALALSGAACTIATPR